MLVATLAAGWAATVSAHDLTVPIAGDALQVVTSDGPESAAFLFARANDPAIRLEHAPNDGAGFAVLVTGAGSNAGRTPLLELDGTHWSGDGAWVYDDPTGAIGGITRVEIEEGSVSIAGAGAGWSWSPSGSQDEVSVHFRLDDLWYCATFATGAASVSANEAGRFEASAAPAPLACDEAVCGNGVLELGEECDDGNLEEGDGCDVGCTIGACFGEEFDSTFDAIQSVIFDGYSCSNAFCHGGADPAGGLDLTAGSAYVSLMGADGLGAPSQGSLRPRVHPSEPERSYLWLKLAAKTSPELVTEEVGTPMPSTSQTVTEDHLGALRMWLRGGAPRDLVVEGTSEKLGSCLPEPDPLILPPPPPPDDGVQIRHGLWPLPPQDENEVCMAHYFDFDELVPEDARVECPERFQFRRRCGDPQGHLECRVDDDCPGETACDGAVVNNALNPDSECFAVRRLEWAQDAQSHHGVILNYSGKEGVDHPDWGDWTYKFRGGDDPLQGQPCDPTAIDPATGMAPNCSSEPIAKIGCTFYGPPDYGNAGSIFSAEGTANQFAITQEPYLDLDLEDGAYFVFPIKGITVFNSHAFNFTNEPTELASYLNLELARGEERRYPVVDIFDVPSIFAMDVPPFGRQEVCRTFTFPDEAHVFRISSHTHKRGVLFRVWEPPNTPCTPECPPGPNLCELPLPGYHYDLPSCTGPREGVPFYYSTDYSDPVNLEFDPPMVVTGEDERDRTFLYCSVYENGYSESGPEVKRQSTSPAPADPDGLGAILGGPCHDVRVACLNDGAMKGEKCFGDDAVCDSFAGAGDGVCDACPAVGGTTTDDEMFVLFGDYYVAPVGVPEPGAWAASLAALVALGGLASRRRRA